MRFASRLSSFLSSFLPFLLAFVLALACALGLVVRGLDAAGVEAPTGKLDVGWRLVGRLAAMASSPLPPSVYRVAFMGDSTVVSYPRGLELPSQLQLAVDRDGGGRPPIRVYSIGYRGTGIFDYYYLADQIVAARPDLVIIPFNLAALSPLWREAFSRPELSGWMSPDRLVETLVLPVGSAGLTVDQALIYSAILHGGAGEAWQWLRQQQLRVGRGREEIQDWVAVKNRKGVSAEKRVERKRQLARYARTALPGELRYNAAGMRDHYGTALAGLDERHATLRLLAATLRRFREAGVESLVYVVPVNYEHVQRMGIAGEAGFFGTLEAVEATVRGQGGRFLDLHALLPDALFRDAAGHFVHEGQNGPGRVAEALAPAVAAAARGEAVR